MSIFAANLSVIDLWSDGPVSRRLQTPLLCAGCNYIDAFIFITRYASRVKCQFRNTTFNCKLCSKDYYIGDVILCFVCFISNYLSVNIWSRHWLCRRVGITLWLMTWMAFVHDDHSQVAYILFSYSLQIADPDRKLWFYMRAFFVRANEIFNDCYCAKQEIIALKMCIIN